MSRILCSTGTLIGRPNGRDYTLLADFSKKLSCDGFEFMMYDSWYEKADEMTEALLNYGMDFPVMHCEKRLGEAISKGGAENFRLAETLFEKNCTIAQKLGAKKLVLHLWDGITSDQNFENNLLMYPQLCTVAEQYGIDLLVENVVCNRRDPMTHLCEIAEKYPDAGFVFDTKMAAFHDQLELLYDEEHAWLIKDGHFRHFHVNDYNGGYMDWENLKTLPIGSGKIDFDRFFAFTKRIGYDDTYTVEATAFNREGVVDLEMLNRCFEKIRSYTKNSSCE